MSEHRCAWAGNNLLMIKYHDEEWGVPVHDDRKLFEFLLLESAQAGLTWQTILNKRENYNIAYDGFDATKIANYTQDKIDQLMNNDGIVRNKLKITSTIRNAQLFLDIQKEFGSFNKYIWQFVNYNTITNNIKTTSDIPTTMKCSDNMSQDLMKKGFKFVGSKICYAFMQAVGMINDHEISCFRYQEVCKVISNI